MRRNLHIWTEKLGLFLKAGKNCNGYFSTNDLIQQVDKAIDICKDKTQGFATGLFLFDNAPSHQKCADDALSARKMPKNLKEGWTHQKDDAQMQDTQLFNSQIQSFYYNDHHPEYPG